jgi:RNA 2',3'-cyclic 3'-phosphodiesterase
MKDEIEKARCFVALDLPQEMIDSIREYQKELSLKNLCKGRLTNPDNMHLTLKFLGEIPLALVEKARNNLKNVKFNTFFTNITKAGVFNEKFIRIVWLALGKEEVLDLQRKVDDALEDDFDREARFMGHVTIVRVNSVKDKDVLIDYLRRNPLPDLQAKIVSFSLIKSTLTPEGPIYEVIEKYSAKEE